MVRNEKCIKIVIVAVQCLVITFELNGNQVGLVAFFEVFPWDDKMLVLIANRTVFPIYESLMTSIFECTLKIELQILCSVIAEADVGLACHGTIPLSWNIEMEIVKNVFKVLSPIFGQDF